MAGKELGPCLPATLCARVRKWLLSQSLDTWPWLVLSCQLLGQKYLTQPLASWLRETPEYISLGMDLPNGVHESGGHSQLYSLAKSDDSMLRSGCVLLFLLSRATFGGIGVEFCVWVMLGLKRGSLTPDPTFQPLTIDFRKLYIFSDFFIH